MVVDGHAFVEFLLVGALGLVDVAEHSLQPQVFVASVAVFLQHWVALSQDFDEVATVLLDPEDIVLLRRVVLFENTVEGEGARRDLEEHGGLIEDAVIDLILIGEGDLPFVFLVVVPEEGEVGRQVIVDVRLGEVVVKDELHVADNGQFLDQLLVKLGLDV